MRMMTSPTTRPASSCKAISIGSQRGSIRSRGPSWRNSAGSPEHPSHPLRDQAALITSGSRTLRAHVPVTPGGLVEVKAAGMVGEQPMLRPGELFEYTPAAPRTTACGFMVGSYQIETDRGEIDCIFASSYAIDRNVHS